MKNKNDLSRLFRSLAFVVTLSLVLISVSSARAEVTNIALGAPVELKGAPFFTDGWGGGLTVDAGTVTDGIFLPRSTQWDQGAVWWDSHDGQDRYMEIDLGHLYRIESFIVQADDNEAYELYYWDEDTGSWLLAWTVPDYDVYGWGMQTRPNPDDDTERYVLAEPIVTSKLKFNGNNPSSDLYFSVSEIQAFGERAVIQVGIDIKPNSDRNCINSNDHGVIPVAILGSATFDASTVDPLTVSLDGAPVKEKGKSGRAGSLEDANGDGFQDLVVHIIDNDTYTAGDTLATLNGFTYDGTPIMGTDTICIVPPQ